MLKIVYKERNEYKQIVYADTAMKEVRIFIKKLINAKSVSQIIIEKLK